MNLLVTGGCGFIGSHVLDHVISQPEVTRVVNLDCLTYAGRLENVAAVAAHPKYRFEQVDLRDKTATLRVVRDHAITHVLHLAAESHVDRSIDGPAAFVHTNLVGTFTLLQESLRAWRQADAAGREWNVATSMVINGKAGMQIMGDWAKSEFTAASKVAASGVLNSRTDRYRPA